MALLVQRGETRVFVPLKTGLKTGPDPLYAGYAGSTFSNVICGRFRPLNSFTPSAVGGAYPGGQRLERIEAHRLEPLPVLQQAQLEVALADHALVLDA